MQNEETKPVEVGVSELDDLALEQVAGGCAKMREQLGMGAP